MDQLINRPTTAFICHPNAVAIAREIVHALGGTIQLNNRIVGGEVVGLDASITLPLDGGNKIEES